MSYLQYLIPDLKRELVKYLGIYAYYLKYILVEFDVPAINMDTLVYRLCIDGYYNLLVNLEKQNPGRKILINAAKKLDFPIENDNVFYNVGGMIRIILGADRTSADSFLQQIKIAKVLADIINMNNIPEYQLEPPNMWNRLLSHTQTYAKYYWTVIMCKYNQKSLSTCYKPLVDTALRNDNIEFLEYLICDASNRIFTEQEFPIAHYFCSVRSYIIKQAILHNKPSILKMALKYLGSHKHTYIKRAIRFGNLESFKLLLRAHHRFTIDDLRLAIEYEKFDMVGWIMNNMLYNEA